MYELKLANYQGPLEKLLELIEERQMDITSFSLAAVTDDFLKYLEGLAEVSPALLADFLVVASRLVLLKSKSLLPSLPLTEEEEEDIRDLETRLILYQKLKAAQVHAGELWRQKRHAHARPYFMQLGIATGVFQPGGNVTQEEVVAALQRVYESLQKFVLATETITEKVISLEEKMRDIVRRMEEFAETSFRKLSEGIPRADAIVAFLAVLHLAREQLLILEQEAQFSDIIIRKLALSDRPNEETV